MCLDLLLGTDLVPNLDPATNKCSDHVVKATAIKLLQGISLFSLYNSTNSWLRLLLYS